MREFYEHSKGNLSFKVKPIDVSTWIDNNGQRWVRVDDYGMGMNEYVIQNHLLNKGNSYYKSDTFKFQKLKISNSLTKDFTPISRFGIGLLSCFILGDKIDINTMPIDHSDKIRLSISGMNNHYILQSENEKHIPIEMPKQFGDEKSYRTENGSSISIRINANKDHLNFEKEFPRMLKEYCMFNNTYSI